MPSRVNENLLSSGHSPNNYTQSGDNIVDNHFDGIDTEFGTVKSNITTLEGKIPLNKFDATSDPTINDDDGDGYAVGSQWHNTSNSTVWFCLDASTGAAQWEDVTSDGSPSVLKIDFEIADWTGPGPTYTLTKAHGFGKDELFIAYYDTTGKLLPPTVSGTYAITVDSSNITFLNTSKVAGTFIVTDASGGFRSSRTPAVLLSELKTVDGSGSGLDADTLDGSHASQFASSSHTHSIASVTGLQTALDAKAPLASPALTGAPVAPTPSTSDDSTKLATTAFVKAALAAGGATAWNAAVTHAVFVSENGNDSTGDGSPGNPYATLTKALTDATGSVDTVFIQGTITETATVYMTGTSNISVIGIGKSQTKITNSTTNSTIDLYATSDISNILFKNLTIENAKDTASSNGVIVGAANGVTVNARFEGVEFSGRAVPLDITTSANGTANLTFEDTTITWGEEPTTGPTTYKGISASAHTGSGTILFETLTFTSIGPEDDLDKPVYGIENYSSGGSIDIRNLYGVFSATTSKPVFVVYDNAPLNTNGITLIDSNFELDAPGISGDVGTLALGVYGAKCINVHVKVNRLDGSTSPSYAILDPDSGSDNITGILQLTASGAATCYDAAVKLADGGSDPLFIGNVTAKLIVIPDEGNTVIMASESGALRCDCNIVSIAGSVDATIEVASVGSPTSISAAQVMYIESASSAILRMKSFRGRLVGLSADVDFSANSVIVRYDGNQNMEFIVEGPSSMSALVENLAYDDVVTSSSYAMDREGGSAALTFARPTGLVSYSGFSAGANTGITATALGGTI